MGYNTQYTLEIVPPPNIHKLIELVDYDRHVAVGGGTLGSMRNEPRPEVRAAAMILGIENAVYALGPRPPFTGGDSCKWYEHEADLLRVSAAVPEVLLILDGVGEEPGDIWRKYFKGGRLQDAKVKITYDKFDEAKLQ